MKRLTFQANEVVELVMPASEAMLSCRQAGRRVRLRVTESTLPSGGTRYRDRSWARVEWVAEPGVFFPSGYTLAECGIRVTDHGYEGQAPGGDDPSPETVQREAAELTAVLARLFA